MTRIEILNRLEERSLGYRRLDDFMAPDFFKMECRETGVIRPGLDANEQWCLSATLSVDFWANRAQYQHTKEAAEHALVHRLYYDVLGDIAELRLQINSGDRNACLRIVDQIQSKLTD